MTRQAAIEAIELLFEMDVLTDHEYGFSAEDVVDAVLKADGTVQALADAWNARNKYQREDIYGYWPEFSNLLDAVAQAVRTPGSGCK